MKASICPKTFDLSAPMIIENLMADSNIDSSDRRVSRTKTLDGGAVFYDAGYTDADRDLALIIPRTEALLSLARHFHKTYSDLTISIRSGIFACVIQRVTVGADDITLDIMLKGIV